MPYSPNTATLIQFLRPGSDPIENYRVSDRSGVITIDEYSGPGIVPTEQELTDAENDLTTVDHGTGPQTFAEWKSWRGGDVIKTKRMKALTELTGNDGLRVLLRGLSSVIQDEIRNIKSQTPKPNRTLAELEAELTTAILSGLGDD